MAAGLFGDTPSADGAKVNAVLAKAKAAGVYDSWYEACQLLAEIKTIDELGYDEEGNKITE